MVELRQITADQLPMAVKPDAELSEKLYGWFGQRTELAVINKITPYNAYDGTTSDYVRLYCQLVNTDSLGMADSLVVKPSLTVTPAELPKAIVAQQRRERKYQMFLGEDFYKHHTGADPEIFVVDEQGTVIPSWEFLPAKENGLILANAQQGEYYAPGSCGKVYWDGFQAEIAVYDSHCHAWCVDSIHNALKLLREAATAYNPKARLTMQTVVEIPARMRQAADDAHVALGCKPSFNAYNARPKADLTDGRALSYRCAGGHLHFSLDGAAWTDKDLTHRVKTLDRLLGIPLVSMFAEFDTPLRREQYGLAGEYRKPKYGLEYRTPSNMWMCHPAVTHLVMDYSRRLVQYAGKKLAGSLLGDDEEVQSIINNCDVKAARAFMDQHEDYILSILAASYKQHFDYGYSVVDAGWKLLRHGVEAGIKDPLDVVKNWKLDWPLSGGMVTRSRGVWKLHSETEGCQWRSVGSAIAAGQLV